MNSVIQFDMIARRFLRINIQIRSLQLIYYDAININASLTHTHTAYRILLLTSLKHTATQRAER